MLKTAKLIVIVPFRAAAAATLRIKITADPAAGVKNWITGSPVEAVPLPTAGSAVILIRNVAAAAALNGTITINFAVFNMA